MSEKLKNIGAALITGGAKRIGKEIALTLAKKGYDIAISYNNSDVDAKKLAARISDEFSVKCEIFKADLNELDQAKEMIQDVIKKFPHLNLLVNNASIFEKSRFLDEDGEKGLVDNLNLHFLAPLILSKEFAKNSPESGQIINMIDKNVNRFETKYFYYILSKKILAQLTQMLAVELAPKIRVNGISPGFILEIVDNSRSEAEIANIINKIPLKKKGDPKNICQAVSFLLDNDFVNGQIIDIDGGASLNHAG